MYPIKIGLATLIGAASDKNKKKLKFPFMEIDGINFKSMTYI